MAYKREDINGTSPLDIKKINDNLRNVWTKVFGDINFSDADKDLKKKILTQWIPVQGEGNFDVNYPMNVRFFVPINVNKIVATSFNLFCEKYRMDSGVAESGGVVEDVDITMSMSESLITANVVDGGANTSYVNSWGNWNPDDPDASSYDIVTCLPSFNLFKEIASNNSNKYSGISDRSPYGLYSKNEVNYRFAPVYRGWDGETYSMWVDLATLQHKHQFPNHGHKFTQSKHNHNASGIVSLGPHEHPLKEGVKVSTVNATGVGVKINGELFANMDSLNTNTINNLDISKHIKIGQWNVIECTTLNLARLTIYGTVEVEIKP